MKRLIACLAVLSILFTSCALAANAPKDKLEERMLLQYQKSGFYTDLTADIKGDSVEWMDDVTWAMLKTLLPGAKVSYESTIRQQNRESTLTLTAGGGTLAAFTALENGEMTLVTSDLTDAGLWYGAPASYSVADLIAYARGGESASFPSLLGVLINVTNANDDWQGRAGAYMNAYLTELGVWMQKYTKVSIAALTDGTTCTEMRCVIPAAEVKNELKSLLSRLYADTALLTILREVLSADESAAYLDPTMLAAFSGMIDGLDIEGDVEVLRRFNLQGQAVLESITLPFAKGQPLSALHVAVDKEGGEHYDIEAAFPADGGILPGASVKLSAIKDEEGAYTGDLVVTLPLAAEEYTVVENATYELSYTYYFFCDLPEQTYDYENDAAARTIDVMLALTPAQGNDGHRHSATLHADFSSRSSDLKPTRLNASLSVMDLTTDSGVTLNLSARTAVAWTPGATVAGVPSANILRVDQMEKGSLTALVSSFAQGFAAKIASLVTAVAPYTVVGDDSTAP